MGTENNRDSHALQDLNDLEEEDVMDISSIQGDILTGYLKDHQTLIFLHILEGEETRFHKWLGKIEPLLDSKKPHLQPGEYNTWVNIAFSLEVLERLSRAAPQFKNRYFTHKKAVPAGRVSSPTEQHAEESVSNRITNGDSEADVVLIVASNSKTDMAKTVARLEDTIRGLRDDNGQRVRSGAEVMFKQIGATLAAPLTGHEQFGFRDGISQSNNEAKHATQLENFLSPRQNPNSSKHGKTIPSNSTAWASKQADQATDSTSIQHRRVTYSAISHEYTIDMKGIQENSKRQFVPTYLGLPELVPSNYMRAWRYQVQHHTPKGAQPVREAIASEGHRRNSALGGREHQST
ncbi:MAG: hypothetical protein ABIO92_08665 [Chloroflexia bacterium]